MRPYNRIVLDSSVELLGRSWRYTDLETFASEVRTEFGPVAPVFGAHLQAAAAFGLAVGQAHRVVVLLAVA